MHDTSEPDQGLCPEAAAAAVSVRASRSLKRWRRCEIAQRMRGDGHDSGDIRPIFMDATVGKVLWKWASELRDAALVKIERDVRLFGRYGDPTVGCLEQVPEATAGVASATGERASLPPGDQRRFASCRFLTLAGFAEA